MDTDSQPNVFFIEHGCSEKFHKSPKKSAPQPAGILWMSVVQSNQLWFSGDGLVNIESLLQIFELET